jgi:tetratricopeptide (TPR) repeat protein
VLSDLPAPVLSDLPAPVLSDLPASVLSDLPAAVLSDLPAAANVGLPSPAKVGHPPAAAKAPPALNRPTLGFGEIDLPVAANDLPALASALPSVAQSLPTVAQSLPTVAQSLPTVAQSLPTVAQSLPTVAQSLPTAKVPLGAGSFPPAFGVPPSFGSADDFGELELPRAPPAAARGAKPLDSPAPEIPGFGLDSPAPEHGGPVDSLFDENPFSSVAPPTPGAGVHGAGGELGFGELDIPGPPPERRGTFSDPVPQSERGSVGGMAFGELDLGEGGASSDLPNDNPFGEASLGSVIQPPPTAHDEASRASARPSDFARAEGFAAPTEAQLDSGTTRQKREPRARVAKGPSPVPKILAGLAVVLVLGGTAATFTPAGFFGKDLVNDSMHAAEYAKLAETSVSAVHDGLASDNFGDAEAMADRLAATRAAKPRARALTAVAAIAELETQLRFGKDPERANRAKLWLTDIPAPNSPTKVKYLDVAQTAAAALDRDRDKARAGFDAASRKYAGDPILQDIAFMRGQLELRAGDAAAATTAFKQALALAPGARAHFGLAQAAFLAGDAKTAASELDATIAAAPKHGAALLLRAEVAWSQGRDDSAAELALKDLSTLLEGPAKTSISTGDQSQAYAWRGVIQFARGRSAEARKAFDDALKADERDVTALIGQGDVLYDEGRYTEAISRYETAKQVDPNAVAAITGAAKTEIALERPLDAKTHLIDAVKRFPKSVLALQWLATSEAALGDRKSAEKDFLGAIDLIDPRDPDGIEPYAAYASFLATQGRGDEAQAKLQEAVKKLPDSVVLERTLGDVAVVQGRFDEALQRYHAALSMDARDVSSRFRLGQVLRKTNKIDEASKVFDDVYAADKNYPGLSLERGLLFEQSGDVEKALDQFKSALERAPNDPDLKLRVGASYVAIGQGEKAEPLLKEVGKDRPNSAEADYYLGRALLLQGPMHYQEAMRHLQLAASREANRAEYHLYVGWLANLEMPPDLGLAHKEIEKALALDQTLADAYWQMGVTEFLTAQYDYSIRDLQHALQLKPTLFEVHAWLAQDYDTKNMPDAVVAEWRLALAHEDDKSIDPLEVADWNRRFGTVLNDRGQYAEAAKRLKSAVGVGESSQPRPPWLTRAELAVAEALRKVGDTAGSCTHYASFVQMADQNNPDRRDARKTCRDVCGKPCEISP